MAVDWLRYRRTHRLPWLARLIIRSWVIGCAIGVAVAGAFVWSDATMLGSLIRATEQPVIAFLLLAFGFATLIGGLYAASAIMLLPYHAEDDAWRRIEP
jgi:hypothetical protein